MYNIIYKKIYIFGFKIVRLHLQIESLLLKTLTIQFDCCYLFTIISQLYKIQLGERVIYTKERNFELQELRGELKKAKLWKLKYDKSGFDASGAIQAVNMSGGYPVGNNHNNGNGSGGSNPSGGASAEVLNALLTEAQSIRVDLSAYTDAIIQVNKTYCLCRQLYFGEMVGCDTCDEWYHFACVGLSLVMAEKCEKYVCVRCALHTSFLQAATMAAQVTNKWMNNEHFRSRDAAYQKVIKFIIHL